MRSTFRTILMALIGTLIVVGSATALPASGNAGPAYPSPPADPFFWAPDNIGSFQPGDVVRVRKLGLDKMAFFPMAEGWQVAFRSTNSSGHPIMGMTTVMRPHHAAAVNPPVVSYQAIVNSIGTQCNPSQSIWNTELQDGPGFEIPLARGWVLNIPDHLGPTAAYGAARLGGMVTLDSVRAIKRVAELNLADSPTVLAGYSGGALASAWAAALQPKYAPELKLAGVAYGGLPSDYEEMVRSVGWNWNPGFGLGFAAVIGLEREYPERFPASEFLNNHGVWLRDFMKDGCRRFLLFHGALRSAAEVAAVRDESMIPPTAFQVAREQSLRYDDGVPQTPLYIWHGRFDSLTPFDGVQDVVNRYCGQGVPVDFHPYDIAEHMTTAVAGFPAAWMWVESRFRGDPAPSTC